MFIRKSYFVICLIASSIVLFCAGCKNKSQTPNTAKDQKPNVIIIYADDVGYGDLSCNGEPTIKTPNVERLAARGVRFTNAHSTSSTSTPSRFGLLTGMYPWRRNGTGIARGDAGMIIKPNDYTIADMMKSVGYTTAAVGKWHLGLGSETGKQDWNKVISPALVDIGFDYSFIMAATADRVPCVYIENGCVVDGDEADPIEVSYSQPFPGEPTGKDNPELLTKMKPAKWHGHDQTIVNGISRIGWMKGGKKALWRDEDIADRITEKALSFIKDNANKNPFFLYFGTNDIHVPRVPNERFVGKSGMGPRGDAILEFDDTVRRVLDLVDELNIADNTLIILSSDNGPVVDDGYQDQAVELLGSHRPWGDFRGGKYSIFEAGTRVPMVVSYGKETPAGMTSDAMVSHIDILASVAKLVGATIPEGAARDSQNHIETLLGKNVENRPYIVQQSTGLSIVVDNWKYIEPNNGAKYGSLTNTEFGNDPMPQLYNLAVEKGERTNLAEKEVARVEELKALLQQIKQGK